MPFKNIYSALVDEVNVVVKGCQCGLLRQEAANTFNERPKIAMVGLAERGEIRLPSFAFVVWPHRSRVSMGVEINLE